MKNLLAFLLALTIGAQHCVQLGLYAWYNFNKQAITQQLCENKSRPEMHCEGKCYLSKQLKKAEEGEKRTASSILKEKQEYVHKTTSNRCTQPIASTAVFRPAAYSRFIPASPVLEEVSPPG